MNYGPTSTYCKLLALFCPAFIESSEVSIVFCIYLIKCLISGTHVEHYRPSVYSKVRGKSLHTALPSPACPSGVNGHISDMATHH